MTRTALVLSAVALGAGLTACSVLLDWSDFSGGAPDAAIDARVEPPAPCDGPRRCVAAPPTGWTGPVALYEGSAAAGSATACGEGYDARPAFDGNADLTAPAPSCAACSCGPPASPSCAAPEVRFFADNGCTTPCGAPVSPVLQACTTTPSCAALMVDPPAVRGPCAPAGGTASIVAVTWGRVARACAPALGATRASCGAGEVCAPAASAPYSSRLCVVQDGTAAPCPAAFPSGPRTYFGGVLDTRACAPCSCSAPKGRCTIASPAFHRFYTAPCLAQSGTLPAPSGCTATLGAAPVMLVATPSLVDAGACVPDGGVATGEATGSGAVTFCCEP